MRTTQKYLHFIRSFQLAADDLIFYAHFKLLTQLQIFKFVGTMDSGPGRFCETLK